MSAASVGISQQACAAFGFRLPADQQARDLTIAEQKMTEILKAMVRQARFLIMDEPTDALSGAEIEHLFRIIRELQVRRGHRAVHHPLPGRGVRDHRPADRVARRAPGGHGADRLGEPGTGRAADDRQEADAAAVADRRSTPRPGGDPGGRARPARGRSRRQLRGLPGRDSGHYGGTRLRQDRAGPPAVRGGPGRTPAGCSWPASLLVLRSPRDAVRHGIGMLPEDRKRLRPDPGARGVQEPEPHGLERYTGGPVLLRARELEAGRRIVEQLDDQDHRLQPARPET